MNRALLAVVVLLVVAGVVLDVFVSAEDVDPTYVCVDRFTVDTGTYWVCGPSDQRPEGDVVYEGPVEGIKEARDRWVAAWVEA